MNHSDVNGDTVIDYITGQPKRNAGAEANRQAVERLLVAAKGYAREDIDVDVPIRLDMDGESYQSTVDLVISVLGVRFMVVKCAAGALASREREVIAAARLLMENYQIPLAVASDGQHAIVWDAISGQCLGEDLNAIPPRESAIQAIDSLILMPLDEDRRVRQQLIFKSYDSMNVHRSTDLQRI